MLGTKKRLDKLEKEVFQTGAFRFGADWVLPGLTLKERIEKIERQIQAMLDHSNLEFQDKHTVGPTIKKKGKGK